MEPQQPTPPTPPPQYIPPVIPPTQTPPTKSWKKVIISGAIGGILVVVSIVAYAVFFTKLTPAVTSTHTTASVVSLSDAYDQFRNDGIKEFSADAKQKTLAAYNSLAEGFTFTTAFPSTKRASLAALAIARLAADNSTDLDTYKNELYLLSIDHLSTLPSGISDSAFTTFNDGKAARSLFEQYKDSDLSQKFSSTLESSGVKSDVEKSLGISTLSAATTIVMNFDSSSDGQRAFNAKHGNMSAEPTMWVESYDGSVYVLATKDYAEDFIADPSGSTRNKVAHELVHTQQNYVIGDLGHSIEERRAEYFSGDKSAYYDVKQLYTYFTVFSGFDLLGAFTTHPADPDSYYLAIYSQLGIETANKLLADVPVAYEVQSTSPAGIIASFTQGHDGIIQDGIRLGSDDPSAVTKRMGDRYAKLLSVFKTKQDVLDDIDSNLKQSYAMPSAASKMTDYIAGH